MLYYGITKLSVIFHINKRCSDLIKRYCAGRKTKFGRTKLDSLACNLRFTGSYRDIGFHIVSILIPRHLQLFKVNVCPEYMFAWIFWPLSVWLLQKTDRVSFFHPVAILSTSILSIHLRFVTDFVPWCRTMMNVRPGSRLFMKMLMPIDGYSPTL